jgi:Holliday junction DNA helicase RuvA
MIGRLRGLLVEKHPPHLVIDTQGVGYEIEAPMSTFYELPELGKETVLFTHLSVRDDAHVLYGFARQRERSLFRSLIRVNGVGPKLALAILSGMDADTFSSCVHDADTAALTRLPGIGKKTAERLVMEMRDRLVETAGNRAGDGLGLDGRVSTPVQDAVNALETLGFKLPEAQRLVKAVEQQGLASEEIIRRALQATVQR